jgi:hypothetical protein
MESKFIIIQNLKSETSDKMLEIFGLDDNKSTKTINTRNRHVIDSFSSSILRIGYHAFL